MRKIQDRKIGLVQKWTEIKRSVSRFAPATAPSMRSDKASTFDALDEVLDKASRSMRRKWSQACFDAASRHGPATLIERPGDYLINDAAACPFYLL